MHFLQLPIEDQFMDELEQASQPGMAPEQPGTANGNTGAEANGNTHVDMQNGEAARCLCWAARTVALTFAGSDVRRRQRLDALFCTRTQHIRMGHVDRMHDAAYKSLYLAWAP